MADNDDDSDSSTAKNNNSRTTTTTPITEQRMVPDDTTNNLLDNSRKMAGSKFSRDNPDNNDDDNGTNAVVVTNTLLYDETCDETNNKNSGDDDDDDNGHYSNSSPVVTTRTTALDSNNLDGVYDSVIDGPAVVSVISQDDENNNSSNENNDDDGDGYVNNVTTTVPNTMINEEIYDSVIDGPAHACIADNSKSHDEKDNDDIEMSHVLVKSSSIDDDNDMAVVDNNGNNNPDDIEAGGVWEDDSFDNDNDPTAKATPNDLESAYHSVIDSVATACPLPPVTTTTNTTATNNNEPQKTLDDCKPSPTSSLGKNNRHHPDEYLSDNNEQHPDNSNESLYHRWHKELCNLAHNTCIRHYVISTIFIAILVVLGLVFVVLEAKTPQDEETDTTMGSNQHDVEADGGHDDMFQEMMAITSQTPTMVPSLAPTSFLHEEVMSIVRPILMTRSSSLSLRDDNSRSCYEQALEWMISQVDRGLVWRQTFELSYEESLIQRYLLSLLYFSSGGGNWLESLGFLSDENECHWNNGDKGVFCVNGKVQKIWIYGNNLTQTIPPELSNLSTLTHINLSDNNLTGTIPPTIAQLTNLLHLDISNNPLLGGPIPIPTPSLFQLTKLTEINLSRNRHTGIIPPSICHLSTLAIISLGNNKLTGTIPTCIGQLQSLIHFNIAECHLTGYIPPTIGALPLLKELWMNDNGFEGTIPQSLGNLVRLTHLYLAGNELDGMIPESLGNLTNLRVGTLNSNSLTGTIPRGLVQMVNVDAFRVHLNHLTGDVNFLCNNSISELSSDCGGENPEVSCSCCRFCCDRNNECLSM